MKHKVFIDGSSLTIDQVLAVVRGQAQVTLSAQAKQQMNHSRAWVDNAVKRRDIVYGISTGFGAFQNISIMPEKLRELQSNLILSHCAGVGEPFPEGIVRGMMLLRANALAKGYSGIRVSVVEMLLKMLNLGIHPVVPSQGSVGASGDLAPLSHMAAAMMGRGKVRVRGVLKNASAALKSAKMKPFAPEAKEGLALNNGTQAMTSVGLLALSMGEALADIADAGVAMTMEAIKGRSAPLMPEVHRVRAHPGQALSAKNIRTLVQGSKLVDRNDDDTWGKVQDSYAVRCAPQVHGASRDAIAYVRRVLEVEINSATDNPLIFASKNHVRSAGNFHGQPIALAMDFLSLAVAELGNISERRTAKLMDKNHSSGLPAFLATNGGVESGLMIAQYTAAALVSENKVLIHPASGDSIPTSANQEDHVSMGTISARHALRIAENVRSILAIELICAAQGIQFRKNRPGNGTTKILERIRKHVPRSDQDGTISSSIEKVSEMIDDREVLPPNAYGKQK